jgi:Winged helix DNA-binding domain
LTGARKTLLDRRTLNRTLLARQFLLERVDQPVTDVVEHLVGLQAQEPPDPYVALWSRIEGFDPDALGAALVGRDVVRLGLMRTTLHLVTARDARRLYPVMRDVMVRTFRSTAFAKALVGVDLDEVVVAARDILEEAPQTPAGLGKRLAERWPDRDGTAMAWAARYHLPLVQVPPRGVWGQTSRAANTTAEAWLGGPVDAATAADDAVLRYLRAFGPATAADIRTWSWLTGLRAVIERLRPRLRSYRDAAGRELLDVEDGVLVDGDVPAPVRFLPQYDNLFLSHDDRSRISGDHPVTLDFGWKGPVLIDGVIGGAWRVRKHGRAAVMTLELLAPVSGASRQNLEAEAVRLHAFVAPDAETRDLRIVEAGLT